MYKSVQMSNVSSRFGFSLIVRYFHRVLNFFLPVTIITYIIILSFAYTHRTVLLRRRGLLQSYVTRGANARLRGVQQ